MKSLYREIKERYYNSLLINFFIIGVAIFAFSRIFQYSCIFNLTSPIKSVLRIASLLFLCPKIFFQDYDLRTTIFSIIIILLTLVCILAGGDNNLILIPVILIGIKDINIKRMVNIIFGITLLCVIIHCLFFMIDYCAANHSFISMFHISSQPEKNKILFYSNNQWAIRFTCCMMQYMYLTNRNNHRYIKTITLFLLSVFMLLISQSRSSFIICFLLNTYMLLESVNVFNKNIVLIRNFSIAFGFVSSILLAIMPMFQNPFFNKIIEKLSERPTIYHNAINYIKVNLLPCIEKFNNMSKVFGSYMQPDNSYISVFLKWGLLISLILFILTFIIINNNKNGIIIDYYIVVLSIWFIVEFISMEFIMYFVPLVIINNYLSDKK